MAEKFSIVKQIDMTKLNEKLAEFFYVNGYLPKIFASNETLEALSKPYVQEIKHIEFADGGVLTKAEGLIGEYQGYEMFEDNTLKYGEIELR
jgi:hypothetical protein